MQQIVNLLDNLRLTGLRTATQFSSNQTKQLVYIFSSGYLLFREPSQPLIYLLKFEKYNNENPLLFQVL